MESLIVLSWNIRGAVSHSHRLNLKKLIHSSKPSVVCVQETKSVEWNKFMKMSIWDADDHGWLFSSSVGLSGGLLLSWDSTIIDYLSHKINRNWICFLGKIILTGKSFTIFNIYAPANTAAKQLLWEEIKTKYWCLDNEPILLIGDFNSVRNANERANYKYSTMDSQFFNNFIDSLGLEEVSSGRSVYTWFGPGKKKSKLDMGFD